METSTRQVPNHSWEENIATTVNYEISNGSRCFQSGLNFSEGNVLSVAHFTEILLAINNSQRTIGLPLANVAFLVLYKNKKLQPRD